MSIDAKITELFEVLNKQKSDLERTKKEIDRKWFTNCSIVLSSHTQPTNIQTANEKTIIQIVSQLIQMQEYNAKAAELLNLPIQTKIDNFEINDWVEDCKKRIAMLQISSKKQKIIELEQRLNAIVSPEQRRQLELEAIAKEIDR